MDRLNSNEEFKPTPRSIASDIIYSDSSMDEQVEQIESAIIEANVVKSFPTDEEVKDYINTFPYYGTCTTEYNEGFEDGVIWLKDRIAKLGYV